MAHALLSASGASRWLSCTPSARLEADLPDETSVYAAEGTFAHEVAENLIKRAIGVLSEKGYKKVLDKLKTNEFWSEELLEAVNQHLDFVLARVSEARTRSKDALVLTEQRLDFSEWVPEGFGTGDVIIISDGVLEIIDYKHGKGVAVDSEGNAQMILYALGALSLYDALYGIHTVKMSISQPRIGNSSTATEPAEIMYQWAEDYLRPRAQLAHEGKGEFFAGSHCKFCKVRTTCRARAEANLALALMDFRKPPLLTVEEIAEVLREADELKSWVADVETYALDQAVNHGVKFPGFKLVEGRSNRVYSDETAVADTLLIGGYTEDQIYSKKLKGITDMEKLLGGKKKFGEMLGTLVIKPEGKPALVELADNRPELNSTDSAKADFSE